MATNNSNLSKEQIIARTKKSFAGPTPKQLEQQAQARARGGLTSYGIRKFQSLTPEKQKSALEKARMDTFGMKTDPTKLVDSAKLQRNFIEAKRVDAEKRGILPKQTFYEKLGVFQRVSPGDISTRDKQAYRLERKEIKSLPKKIIQIKSIEKVNNIKLKKEPSRIEKSTVTKSDVIKNRIIGSAKATGKEIGRETIQGLTNAVVSIYSFAKNPRKAVKDYGNNVKYIIKNPVISVKAFAKKIAKDPVEVAVEFYAFNKIIGISGKAIKKNPLSRAVGEELYIKSFPKEMQKSARAIVKSSKVQEKISPNKINTLKKVDFVDVKNLNKIEAKVVEKTVKQTDSILFGSVPARTISKGKTPKPKDVDLATKNIDAFNEAFIKNLPKSQKSNYIIKSQKIIRKSDGVPILDVKPIDRLIPSKSLLTGKGELPVSGFKVGLKIPKGQILPKIVKRPVQQKITVPTQRIQKVGEIRLVSFGEQTQRKGLGTIQVLVEKNVKRAKDPQSFVLSLEVQLDALKKSGKTGLITKNRIKNLESGIKVLKSKEFENLLNKNVKGLTSEYPILGLFEHKKYSKQIKDLKTINRKNIIIKNGKLVNKNTGKIYGDYIVSSLPSELSSLVPKGIRSSSIIPLIKGKSSSIIPKSQQKPSRIPSSKTPKSKITVSKIPKSKIPLSKIPKPSKVPKVSKIPISKIPLSKIPISKIIPSKIPISRIIKSRIPISRLPPIKTTKLPPKIPKKIREQIDKKIAELKKKKKKVLYAYTPTLAGIGEKAKTVTGKFTGFETRGNIIILKSKPIKVKQHKRVTLKNKAFVRRHRRRKPRK